MGPDRATQPVLPVVDTGSSGAHHAYGRPARARRSLDAVHRRREHLRAHRSLDLAWRVGVALVGVAIILAGVAMLALPGPGWAAVFLGLAVLGSEFAWARRLLRWARRQAARAAAAARDPRRRRRNRILAVVAVLALAAAAWWYLQRYGLSLSFGG